MTRRILFFLFFLCLPFLSFADERILSYDVDIIVDKDSSSIITENIKVRAESNEIKHGIYRDFPTKYTDRYGNKYQAGFQLLSLKRDGRLEPYHFGAVANGVRIYFGDKDIYLPNGEYLYELKYRTTRQIGFFKTHDELYFNAIGTGWVFPVDSSVIRVYLPQDMHPLEGGAYTGPKGARGRNYAQSFDVDGGTVFKLTAPLAAKEGFTIFVSWPKGVVAEPSSAQKFQYFLYDNRGSMVGLLGLLLLLGYYLVVWFLVGRDPKKGVIIPMYDAPHGFSPAMMRYLTRMGFDSKAFAAAIVNMAVKGYLKISNDCGVYVLTRTVEDVTILSQDEALIASKIFSRGGEFEIKQSNHERIAYVISAFSQSLKKSIDKIYFVANTGYFVGGVLLSIVVVASAILLQSAEKIPIAIFISVWLTIWSLGVTALIVTVVQAWKKVVSNGGGIHFVAAAGVTLFSVPFIIGECVGLGVLWYAASTIGIVVLLGAIFLDFLFYKLLKAPTLSGRAIMDKIGGFRMYLSVAEKDNLNNVAQPAKTPQVFEKFLPYAIALGVEETWAEKFSALFSDNTRSYSPTWYSAGVIGGFSAHAFCSAVSSGFADSVSSSSHAPGSGSGSSGSSGGGGGGGGGGGW